MEQPPALDYLLDDHQRQILRPGHQRHPPAQTPLLQIV
jgi:hypothetical protein